MSDPKDDGGPAFPDHALPHRHNGMSLRDYFAAQLLCGIFADGNTDCHDEILAQRCYEAADAMLKERAK